jgi:hypothetical protein
VTYDVVPVAGSKETRGKAGEPPRIGLRVAEGHQHKAARQLDAAEAAVRLAVASLKADYYDAGDGRAVAEAEAKLAAEESALSDTDAGIATANQDIDRAILAGDPTTKIRARLRTLGDQRDDHARRVEVLRRAVGTARESAAAALRDRVREMIAAKVGPAVERADRAHAELVEKVSTLFWEWATATREAAVWQSAMSDPDRVMAVLLS